MPKLSVAKFAAHLPYPISRQRCNEFVNRGDLIRGADKKIDTDHPVNAAWLRSRSGVAPPATGRPEGAPLAPHQRPPEPPDGILDDGMDGDFDADAMLDQVAGLNFAKLTKTNVDKIHKIEALLKVRIERQHKRRELIERSLVQTVFSRLYQIDSNEMKTLGAKLAPAVSGMLGVDAPDVVLRIEQMIDAEIIKSLAHIKRVLDDFLIGQGAAGVQAGI